MGQAKQRGTREQRIAAALQYQLENPPAPKPKVKLSRKAMQVAAILAGAGFNGGLKMKGE